MSPRALVASDAVPQAWITRTLRREVAIGAVDNEDLLEGKARAFVHVHSAAVLHLVADSGTVKADVVSETLLFDVHRLSMLQREYQVLVTASTMLITAAHSLVKNDAPVVARIAELFAPMQEIDLEPTIEAVAVVLKPSSLSPDAQQSLLRALTQCSSPTDAVHQLLSKRMCSLIGHIMHSGKVPADLKFFQYARGLLPRVEQVCVILFAWSVHRSNAQRPPQLATKIMSVCNINRTVHLPTYNKLIGEQALGLRAETGEPPCKKQTV